MSDDYKSIVKHYESCLERHGDSHLGVDWPKLDDALKRYRVMCEVEKFSSKKNKTSTLLDFGCGGGHLLEFIKKNELTQFTYSGCDLSPKFIDLCKSKFPGVPFFQVDALQEPDKLGSYDFIVMNGVFTEKRELTFDEMWNYFQKLVSAVYEKTSIGLAFNVMSKHVDWERNDLFHLSHDLLVSFLIKHLGRNFVIRNDYGLYEYTVYVYR